MGVREEESVGDACEVRVQLHLAMRDEVVRDVQRLRLAPGISEQSGEKMGSEGETRGWTAGWVPGHAGSGGGEASWSG